MTTHYGDLDASIQEKLEADTEFHASIETLSDEEREEAISVRKSEIFSEEVKSLKEQAEEATKAKELAENYKIRAEKAEKGTKEPKPAENRQEPAKTDSDLSAKDLYALIEAKVPQQDIEEVIEAAKVLRKPIADVLKHDVVKGILARRSEERETANAANTGGGRRITNKVTPEALLADLSKGKVPAKGSKEAEDLFWAKRGGKKN